MDTGKLDLIIVLPVAEALRDPRPALLLTFTKCAIWFSGKFESGEVSPPATVRFIEANGQCFNTIYIDWKNDAWDMHVDTPKMEGDFAWPFFAVLEDAQGRKFVARVETDCQSTH